MARIKTLSLDLETFSSVNLQKAGVYKYAESPDFDILLFGYSVDGGAVHVIDLACGEKIPAEIVDALSDESVIKWAFNAQFERVCLSNYLDTWLSPDSWHCTMVWSATLGLPLSLEGVGAVLGLEKQKLTEGKNLIKYFCVPCAPTKTNGGRTRNLPQHDMEKWERSRHIICVMWKASEPSRRSCPVSLFPISSGMNTISTRKSMTVASDWI